MRDPEPIANNVASIRHEQTTPTVRRCHLSSDIGPRRCICGLHDGHHPNSGWNNGSQRHDNDASSA